MTFIAKPNTLFMLLRAAAVMVHLLGFEYLLALIPLHFFKGNVYSRWMRLGFLHWTVGK